MSQFSEFIAGLIQSRYGTADKLSKAIGMSLSAFSRGVRNEGTLSVENCLRLAEETGESPRKVLTLAGKEHVADIIERLHGKSADHPLSGPEREILALWKTIDSESREPIRTLLRALSAKQKGKHRTA